MGATYEYKSVRTLFLLISTTQQYTFKLNYCNAANNLHALEMYMNSHSVLSVSIKKFKLLKKSNKLCRNLRNFIKFKYYYT